MNRWIREAKHRLTFLLDLKREIQFRKFCPYELPDGFQRIYFYHNRKTGGKSLAHVFFALGGEDPKVVDARTIEELNYRTVSNDLIYHRGDTLLSRQGNYFFAFSHTPMHRLQLPPKTFTITILRDPVSRIITHYKMLLRFKIEKIPHPCMKIEGKWLGNNFRDFLNNTPENHFYNQLYKFSRNYDIAEATDNIMACSHFFFTENYKEGLESLSKKLSLPLKPIYFGKETLKFEPTKEEMYLLREKLEPEYRLFENLGRNSSSPIR